MGVSERIFEIADRRFAEQKDFAAAIGVKPQRVSEWRLGKSASYRKYLPQIAATLNTSVEYLLNGTPSTVDADQLSQEDSEILRQIHDRPGMRIMFSLTSKATDEDVKKAAEIIQAFLGKPEDQP